MISFSSLVTQNKSKSQSVISACPEVPGEPEQILIQTSLQVPYGLVLYKYLLRKWKHNSLFVTISEFNSQETLIFSQ